jgi:glycosyltransferase involved in cell wall biosynthesis
LNIIGKGPVEGLINKKIKKLNLNDQIKLLGFQSNPYAFIKNSDLFILSSFYEGMPNVLMEAMAIGGKIIATNCQCGVKELLTDSVVFDKSDKEVLSEFAKVVPVLDSQKNKKIMANEIIRMIKGDAVINNKKRIQKVTTFSFENVTKQWKHVIK